MEVNRNKWAAIIGLHESGFTEDFIFSGKNFLWVQHKIILLPEDVTLIEFYRFKSKVGNDMLIFGVTVNYACIYGILITHYNNYKNRTEPASNIELEKKNHYSQRNITHAVGEIHCVM